MAESSTGFIGLMRLLKQANVDPALVAQIERQYAVDLSAEGDALQTRVWDIGIQLDEKLRTQLGSTNDMISQLADGQRQVHEEVRGSKDALASLGSMFSVFGERLTGMELSVNSLSARMEASETDRANIHREVGALAAEFRAYTQASRRAELDDLRKRMEALERRGEAGDAER